MSMYSLFVSARRRALGLSMAELAEAGGMDRDTLGFLERGRFLPSPSQAWQLALALGINPAEFGRWTIAELLVHPELLHQHVLPEG